MNEKTAIFGSFVIENKREEKHIKHQGILTESYM